MAARSIMSFAIPCGKGGLNRLDNYLDFPIEDLAWVDGIDCARNSWEKEPGATKLNSAALTHDVILANGSQDWTVAVTSNVVTVDTIADHNLDVGMTLVTDADWSDNAFMASLSGKTILSTPTTSTFTFALTQANQGATTETNINAGMTGSIPAPIVGLHDLWNSSPSGSATVPEATTQKILAVLAETTGAIKILDTSGAVLSSQDFASAPSWVQVVDINIRTNIRSQIIFHSSGSVSPKYTVPETYTLQSLSYPAADWSAQTAYPHFGFTHNFRLLCATRNTSVLYMSNPADHTEFAKERPNTRIMDIFPGEQHYLAGGVSWRGLAYLFKWERGIYALDDTDVNIANWQVRKVTDAIGIANQSCLVAIEDDVIILGSDGYFYSLSTIQTLGQQSIPPIFPAELSEFLRDEIDTAQLEQTRSVYFARKRQVWFALPSAGGDGTPNRRLILDFNLPGKIRVLWSERDEMTALTTRRSSNVQTPIWGDTDGFIWVGDKAARNKGGVAFASQFETPPMSLFPLGSQYANLKELQTNFKPQGAYDLTLEVHGDEQLFQTLTLSQQSAGSPSGSFSLDADVLAGTTIQTGVARLEGTCRRIKLVGKNNEEDENFSLNSFNVRFTPGSTGV